MYEAGFETERDSEQARGNKKPRENFTGLFIFYFTFLTIVEVYILTFQVNNCIKQGVCCLDCLCVGLEAALGYNHVSKLFGQIHV